MTTETPTATPPSSRPSARSRAVAAGWVCLVIGMVLMYLSLDLFSLYAPLFLAALILSITAMARKRTVAAVILLVITLSLPSLSWFGLAEFKVKAGIHERQQQVKAALSGIAFEDVKEYVDGNHMYLKGKVRNNGKTRVSSVKVKVDWLDAAGTVLDTGYTYADSREGLRPGSTKSFEISTPVDHRMKHFRYSVESLIPE